MFQRNDNFSSASLLARKPGDIFNTLDEITTTVIHFISMMKILWWGENYFKNQGPGAKASGLRRVTLACSDCLFHALGLLPG